MENATTWTEAGLRSPAPGEELQEKSRLPQRTSSTLPGRDAEMPNRSEVDGLEQTSCPVNCLRNSAPEVIALLRGKTPSPPARRRELASPDPTASPGAHSIASTENLADAFLQVASARAPHPAMITPQGEYSFAWLEAAAMAVRAEILNHSSFRTGDCVVLLLENSPEYVAAFFGVLLAGGVVVPMPPDVERDRLTYVLDVCEADIVLTDLHVLPQRDDLPGQPTKWLVLEPTPPGRHLEFDVTAETGDQLAAILFTSGSTGQPKGVMLSHRNLLSNARSICEYLEISSEERALVVLPFYHAFGNSILQSHLLSGATLILDGSMTFPNSILQAIAAHQATSFSGVPAVFQALLSRSSLGRHELNSLRYMSVAGGALDVQQAKDVARRIAPAKFVVMYGQTEATARLSYLPAEQLAERPGSIGKGIPGVELEVVDHRGHPVAPGQRGEIRARGPNIMLGYWRDQETTSKVIRDGWLYTGDWATIDHDGFIYPQGRANALVKVGGFRVHPSEVEQHIMKRLPLLQAVVVAFESDTCGTRLALFVQPRPGISLDVEHVRRVCHDGLPRHKVPAYIEVVSRLPLNNAMKIDRPRLAQRAQRHSAITSPARADRARAAT